MRRGGGERRGERGEKTEKRSEVGSMKRDEER